MRMQWNTTLSDLPVFCILLFLNFIDRSSQNRNIHHSKWEEISVRYGLWEKLPPFQPERDSGYVRQNHVCKTNYYHGFLFVKNGNRKAMPIYDLNGNLAGIQAAIPSNMKGLNSLNETINLPPDEIMPPVLKGLRDEKGLLYYTVTAYFKHPKLICSPITSNDVSPGRGLYIQMGFDPELHHEHIDHESKHLSPLWRQSSCVPMMGTHYFKNLSVHLPCEKLYPVFLMYNREGKLGAFGWVFQGKPDNYYNRESNPNWFTLRPDTYPFLYEKSMLPPCMKHNNFHVFGMHVYLQDHKKLLCTDLNNDDTRRPSTRRPTDVSPRRTYITVLENKANPILKSNNNAIDAYSSASREKLSSLHLAIFCSLSVFSTYTTFISLQGLH